MNPRLCLLRLLCCFASLAVVAPAGAQEVVRLVEYTQVWRYDQSGTDLGTAWKEPEFDDSAWPTGAGLFGLETNLPPPYPVPLNTPLALGAPTVITYYFRTTFDLAEVPASLAALRATVYADDGCVIYLNGVESGRVRVPMDQNYQTATGTTNVAPYEGYGDGVELRLEGLRAGTNVLGAEVHQSGSGSSDVVWGLKLRAILAEPIRIIQQPVGQALIAGQTNTFSVETEGGPIGYQWFRDGVAVPGATNRTLTLRAVSTNATGDYTVVVSNYFGAQFSQPAPLTVVPAPLGSLDFTGPRLVRAVERVVASSFTNVDVHFTEAISAASVQPSAFVIRSLEDDAVVSVVNTLTSSGTVRLRLAPPNWMTDGSRSYQLIVNGIRDNSDNRNLIAPDSRIPISLFRRADLFPTNATWDYHAFVLEDSSVLEGEWYRRDYAMSEFWRTGFAPFYTPAAGAGTCLGPGLTGIPFQYHPILFRATFVVSNDLPPTTSLILSPAVSGGLVVYLNEREILRERLPAAPAELTVDSRSTGGGNCADRVIPNVRLFPGTNHLACALFQFRDGQAFTTVGSAQFGLAARVEYYLTPQLPEVPPVLETGRLPSALRLAWSGPGFALESTTNLSLGSGSYPFGPWIEVTNMSNPYTNAIAGPTRFFRLTK